MRRYAPEQRKAFNARTTAEIDAAEQARRAMRKAEAVAKSKLQRQTLIAPHVAPLVPAEVAWVEGHMEAGR